MSTEMLNNLILAAKFGGDHALQNQSAAKVVSDEGGGGLTTDADHTTQSIVISKLTELHPDIPILAEEQEDKSASGNRFIVDPIDASVNYNSDGSDWCCTAAYQTDDDINLGVIYQPRRNVLAFAARGRGCILQNSNDSSHHPTITFDADQRFEPRKSVIQMPIGCEFTDEWYEQVFDPIRRNVRFVRNIFSNTGSILELLRGPSIATILTGSLWDIAAGKIMIEEAGGVTGDVYGEPIDVNMVYPQMVIFARSQQIYESLVPLTKNWPTNAFRT